MLKGGVPDKMALGHRRLERQLHGKAQEEDGAPRPDELRGGGPLAHERGGVCDTVRRASIGEEGAKSLLFWQKNHSVRRYSSLTLRFSQPCSGRQLA